MLEVVAVAAPLQLVAVGGEDPVQGVPHDHEHSGLWLRVEKLDVSVNKFEIR